jgi:hypothetical protein
MKIKFTIFLIIKMFTLKKVNNIEIIPTEKTPREIKSSVFKKPQSISLLASRKESGKSTALKTIILDIINHFEVIREKIEKNNNKKIKIVSEILEDEFIEFINLSVYVFCGTVENDDVWDEIKEIFEKSKLINFEIYNSTYKKEGRQKINLIEDLIERLKEEKKNGSTTDNLIIFDDLAVEIKNNDAIVQLFKNMRHWNIINILCCSQSVIDFTRDMWDGSDYMLIFKDMPIERLKHIYKNSSIGLTKPLFFAIYRIATKDDEKSTHNFLMYEKGKNQYYKGFNYLFEIED